MNRILNRLEFRAGGDGEARGEGRLELDDDGRRGGAEARERGREGEERGDARGLRRKQTF